MIKTVGFNLFIKKLVLSSGNFGPSVCFLICVCGTVKTATLSSRVMGNGTCSRASHAAVFSHHHRVLKAAETFLSDARQPEVSPLTLLPSVSAYTDDLPEIFGKSAKSPLPVDMRRSKTSLLKLWS